MSFGLIFVLIVTLALWYIVYHVFAFKLQYSLKNKIILITGCDTGFGNHLAKKLDKMGCIVFATCIGKKTANNLDKATSNNCHIIIMDVTKIDEINAAYNTVKTYCYEHKIPLFGIVNNAGIAESSPFECISRDDFTKVIEVNTIGLINVTRTFLPLIRMPKVNKYLSNKYGKKLFGFYQRGKAGRIVNIASIAGRATAPYLAPYCVSKFGVIAFTDCIRLELQQLFNIWCCTVEPFFVMTNMVESGLHLERVENVWNKAEEDYKKINENCKLMDIYDIEKYLKWKQRTNKLLFNVMDRSTDTVLDCIICGLCSYFPLRAYHPSWISSILYRLERYVFPKWLMESIDKTFVNPPIRDSFVD
eukprot:239620_1